MKKVLREKRKKKTYIYIYTKVWNMCGKNTYVQKKPHHRGVDIWNYMKPCVF